MIDSKLKSPRLLVGILCAGALTLAAGCTEEQEIPPLEVKTVQAYGLTLDASATPEQVTFVLLRSLADDVQAARSGDEVAQKEAQKTTAALAAYSTIEKRLLEVLNAARKEAKTDLGPDRDKRLYEVIHGWAPIVAYYVDSLPKTMDEAAARMRSITSNTTSRVLIDLSHDPAEQNPPKHHVATLEVELTKETAGGATYWRVARLTYRGHPTTLPASLPAGLVMPQSQGA